MNKKLLLHKLPLYLAQLHSAHAAAVGCQLARGVFLECDKEFFRRCSCQSSKELFFEDGEGAFQSFKVMSSARFVGWSG